MATVKEIAAKAGVSIGTVDRVLHGRGRVAESTRTRVFAAVKELDYRPDPHARALSRKKPLHIAVLMPKPDNDAGYWHDPLRGIQQTASNYASFGVECMYHHFDRYQPASIQRAVNKFKHLHIDGMILTGILWQEVMPFLSKMPELPHVVFDTPLPAQKGTLAFLGQDSVRSGLLAGRLMKLVMPEGGEILLTRTAEENSHSDQRVEGFLRVFHNDSHYRLHTVLRTHEKATHVLKKHISPKTAGIFIGDSSVGEAAGYLKKNKLMPHLIGYDLTPKTRAALRSGQIDFSITQSPIRQGQEAADILLRFLLTDQRPHQSVIHMPTLIATAENADEEL